MSVRVVARIRPLLKAEHERDIIVNAGDPGPSTTSTLLTIPNPKNASENYTFNFNSVYGREATQQDIFDNEVSPSVKQLFDGFSVTIFAYGVTGTGKTHTMRGGKALEDRGVIPRLLSSIYRKGRKIDKDSAGQTRVEVSLSYYEIYCDKVYDLFEPPEKRTLAGLPVRDHNGKSVICGLTERPCTSLKEFGQLYDEANLNRSTSATKLNAHSSRSHAILQVNVSQISSDQTLSSTISAIDLAGSEDNRRTENNKERLVESSSINKSLFVLAQCVEQISKRQAAGAASSHIRIPYRESKMTRILSLGQNDGVTIMILNLAPVRSYHLDTLTSLNFANRTKRIEIREVENEPLYTGKMPTKAVLPLLGLAINRQPLRPLPSAVNAGLKFHAAVLNKPGKEFSVFADRRSLEAKGVSSPRSSTKRRLDSSHISNASSRPTKFVRPSGEIRPRNLPEPSISRAGIEELVNRMVDERLAKKASSDTPKPQEPALSIEIQRRLEALEQRVEKKEDGGRAEGLQYLLMAKQHTVRGEENSALKMYRLALPFFPDNAKLASKLLALEERIKMKREMPQLRKDMDAPSRPLPLTSVPLSSTLGKGPRVADESDDEYRADLAPDTNENDDYSSDDDFRARSKAKHKPKPPKVKLSNSSSSDPATDHLDELPATPRSSDLLRIINSRDQAQIRLLRGVGLKKAEAIVACLCELDEGEEAVSIKSLRQLGGLRGVGVKTVENMRSGIAV